jgi:hypothetical protein
MTGTLLLLALLGAFLLALSHAAGGPAGQTLPARLGHGLRELDRLARLRTPVDRAGVCNHPLPPGPAVRAAQDPRWGPSPAGRPPHP